ncbi:MAG TPA: beta-propeller fold lactonase family protein [Candidatus Dormibacteraeota bacterium]
MQRRMALLALPIAAMLAVGGVTAIAVTRIVAGPSSDGTGVTPNGWRLTPAGRQVELADQVYWADRPDGQALSPDGRTLLISSGGQSTDSMKVVDTASGKVVQTIPYVSPEALFVGVAWSPDGKHAYASAGGNNKVRTYTFDGQRLTEGTAIPVPGFPVGLAIAPDGRTLVAAENRADAAAVIDLGTGAVTNVPVGTCDVVQPATGPGPTPPQCQPYGVAFSRNGATAYVSNWGEHSVSLIDVRAHAPAGKVQVGTHPNALIVNPLRPELYVANGDSDTISVIDTGAKAVSRTLDLAPYRGAPEGSNPNALAVAPDGRTLYVANAGNNDVDVISLEGRGRIAGMIPTAWYPTGVDVAPDGRTLFVENAKGLGAGPNVNGPNPTKATATPSSQYVASMMHGTLSIVPVPSSDRLERFTEQVVSNNGFDERDKVRVPDDASGSVIPRRVGEESPIKHVIYVVKENRTYDQVLGSLGKGNGAPGLNLFGEESAPNIRGLARRFVTLDNFYANAEVSADGWNWSTAANANTYVQKTFTENYSNPNRGRGYDFEGGNYATAPNRDPADSYIWDRLHGHNVPFRNYGFWDTGTVPAIVAPTAPNLVGTTDLNYPGYNLGITDQVRIAEWEREFRAFEAQGTLPSVEFVRLPNDHTAGTRVGARTPRAYVADNDLALGRLVQDVSHSRFWASTAIFVVEDDAQNGPDHVDAHRTEALVISPYTQTGRVDSTFYSTVSMLRTMELIVGLRPMTQFDAAATPMLNSFARRPNLRTYDAVTPSQSLTEVNTAAAPMAAQSAAMNFDQADAPSAPALNQAIWQSVKGAWSVMPAPVTTAGQVASTDTDG